MLLLCLTRGLLLVGYRSATRTLASTGVGVRALSPNRQATAMPQAPIGAHLDVTLDVHRDLLTDARTFMKSSTGPEAGKPGPGAGGQGPGKTRRPVPYSFLIILPRVGSCGLNSTSTRSPGTNLTKFLFTTPTKWAKTFCCVGS